MPEQPPPDYPGKPGPKRKPREELPPEILRPIAGTREYEAIYSFVRMTFKEFQKTYKRFLDPFLDLERPKPVKGRPREDLEENKVAKLFFLLECFSTIPSMSALSAQLCSERASGGRRYSAFCPRILNGARKSRRFMWTRMEEFDRARRTLGDPKHHKQQYARSGRKTANMLSL
jgi:hypothetical protein